MGVGVCGCGRVWVGVESRDIIKRYLIILLINSRGLLTKRALSLNA